MKRLILYCLIFLIIPCSARTQTVLSITIDGSINPVSADFIRNSIKKAKADSAECLVIYLNTPGGLLNSTRQIVSDILEAPVPVVVYVGPGGAHAGSAGVFVTLAAHVAVMAPGTNIGAAHPVLLQGKMDSTMNEKATNDAAAFIRTIAEKRNRNIAWAERTVRNSDAYTENEALRDSVIDFIARDETELLAKLEGREVELPGGPRKLHTILARIQVHEMTAGEKMLNMISDPNIAYILMMLGMLGLFFEFSSPGAILPGIVGGISLILAFYAMNSLPVNYAGLALIVFAIILFVLETQIVSHGLLAIGGTIALLLGSLMLIKSTSPIEMAGVSRSVIYAATAVTAALFLVIITFGVKAQRSKVATGLEALIGDIGEVAQALTPNGTVRVQGETWNASSLSGDIGTGEKVRISAMRNHVLYVERV